jgi:hypothetical protein
MRSSTPEERPGTRRRPRRNGQRRVSNEGRQLTDAERPHQLLYLEGANFLATLLIARTYGMSSSRTSALHTNAPSTRAASRPPASWSSSDANCANAHETGGSVVSRDRTRHAGCTRSDPACSCRAEGDQTRVGASRRRTSSWEPGGGPQRGSRRYGRRHVPAG